MVPAGFETQSVPNWLAKLNVSELDKVKFPLADVLSNSLYYPCSGMDGRPVQFIGGFIHSFIYVDYGQTEAELDNEIRKQGFDGYRTVGRKKLTEKDLAPAGWTPNVPAQYADQIQRLQGMNNFIKTPFATWYIFEREKGLTDRHGPERFSFVYIGADGVATYQALYCQNKTAPKMLAIIQPGHRFGGNYTNFTDPKGLFNWVVTHSNGRNIPQYLMYGGLGVGFIESCWPADYPKHEAWLQMENGNGIWSRG
jgi:hypothetical protein